MSRPRARIMKRHGVPATLTSTGRVSPTWVPGEANNLTGVSRLREVWHRLRVQHGRPDAARVLAAMWRHGYVLSGPEMRRP